MAENRDKCAHPSCVCRAVEGSKFCSTFCEGATNHPDITCNCGHSGCSTTTASSVGSTTRSQY